MSRGALLRRRIACLVGGAAVVASLTACQRPGERAPLQVAFTDSPGTIDPHLQNHAVTWSVLGNIYDALVRFSPAMQLEPALAVSWRQVDQTHWVVTLRPGVRFHDGSPFSATDVVASVDRARNHPMSQIKHFLLGVTGARRIDDLTVELETSGPIPDLFNRLTFVFIATELQAREDEITTPIGTGPYRYVGRESDGSIRLEGWDGWRGMPEIRTAVMRFYTNDAAASARFFAHEIDVLHTLADDQVAAVQTQPGLRTEPQPRLAAQLLAVAPAAATGPAAKALADARVRRALLLALDRPEWINTVFFGNGTVASQYVHPVVVGYDPAIEPIPCDPAQARRLLAEAGFPTGFDVELGHGNVDSGVIEAIVSDLAAIGVRVTPRAETFTEILRLARAGKLSLVFYAWACSTGDASDFLNTSIHSRNAAGDLGVLNFSGYADPATDALLEAADREMDPQRRRMLLQQAQRRALAALPVLPLAFRWGYEGVSSRVDVVTRHDERVWLAAYRWRA